MINSQFKPLFLTIEIFFFTIWIVYVRLKIGITIEMLFFFHHEIPIFLIFELLVDIKKNIKILIN